MSLAHTFRLITPKKPTVKESSRKLFWTWIAYQTIKGTLTTALIWAPLAWGFWG